MPFPCDRSQHRLRDAACWPVWARLLRLWRRLSHPGHLYSKQRRWAIHDFIVNSGQKLDTYRRPGEILPRLAQDYAHLCPARLGQENWNRRETNILHISVSCYFLLKIWTRNLQRICIRYQLQKYPLPQKHKLTVGKMLAVFRERESPGQVLESSREEILFLQWHQSVFQQVRDSLAANEENFVFLNVEQHG